MPGFIPRGPLLGASPQLGGQPSWQWGQTPSWVPDWLRNLSAANTAQTQATQQNLAALPPRYAMTPQDINIAMSLGMTGGGLKADMPEVSTTATPETGLTASTDIPQAPGITAYHGSPHSFERFDISKIGTGEGAQAYGHGLYFAENEGVARDYRNKLSPMTPAEAIDRLPPDAQAIADHQAEWDAAVQERRAQAGADLRGDTSAADAKLDAIHQQMVAETAQRNPPKAGGSMYQVRINADPSQFLDWDKPLSEQSPQVQAAIAATGAVPKGSNPVGSDIWQNIVSQHGLIREGAAAPASQSLRDAGIPGIRYLDQASRGAGEGTHNYVVFSDQMIDILKKYGLAGLAMMGAGGLGAAALPNQAQAQSK